MNKQPAPNHAPVTNGIDSRDAFMPGREEFFIENLRESSLVWQSSRTQEERSWQRGGSDPRCPNFDTLSDMDILGMTPRISSRSMMRHTERDWRTIESQTLSAQTDEYDVAFKKTHLRSYSGRLGESLDKCWYTVDFISRSDHTQIFSLDDTKFPSLGPVFEEIATKIS
jgi:hypothetical protein